MKERSKINGGIYLVLDPAIEKTTLLKKLREALDGHIDILQIWNNWPAGIEKDEKEGIIGSVMELAVIYQVPVLINEEWQLVKNTSLDGVHFDVIPQDFGAIIKEIGRDFIAGITCGNDLKVVEWANRNGLDYISFCAMFPSVSVNSCDIVRHENIQAARTMTRMPIFLSGGISAENMPGLGGLDFNGVAIISGILNAASPGKATRKYNQIIDKLNKRNDTGFSE